MKHKMILMTWMLMVSPLAYTQDGRDKAAQEKAELDKQMQYEEELRGKTSDSSYKASYKDTHINNQRPVADPTSKPKPSAQFIPCPVTQIEARITSSIPSDWWDTPQQGSLRNTRVTHVGGEPTLQCLYWAYDREIPLMKRVPAGMHCVAQSNGFSCD